MIETGNIPPRFSLTLIRWLCKADLVEELEGNLYQYYQEHTGKWQNLKYWYQVFCYLRPSMLKTFKLKNSGPMFIFNPLLTIRNLSRHRATSLINILGFTLGLTATIFLYFYLSDELSNDSFHAGGNEIYRVLRVSDLNGDPYRIGVTSGPFAGALQNDFPDAIQHTTRAFPQDGLVAYGDKKFNESKLLFADANFFEFFSFPLVSGNKASVLTNNNSVVISEEMAEKYFGQKDPIGEILELDNELLFEVTGIFTEPPHKSHLDFDMVLTISFFERFEWFGHWWNNGLMTYVKINSPAVAAQVETQLGGFMDKYFGDDFKQSGTRVDLTLEPLSDIYFNRATRYDWARHGNLQTVIILAIVAIAILFIACFNYVNLSIAQSFLRVKEVGVRKVLGVNRKRLMAQILSESLMILLIAILLSIGICELLNPAFNVFFDLDIDLTWWQPSVWVVLVSLILFILAIAGIYPSLLLSSISPVTAMRGGKITTGRSTIRKVLVVTQFAISIFLIVATLLISAQKDFLDNKDLGFEREAVVLVDVDNQQIRNKRQEFKDRLLSNSNIRHVSGVSGEPGGFHDTSGFLIEGVADNNRMRTLFTDQDFLDLFDLNILYGRGFDHNLDADTALVMLVNERALEEIGLTADELIGRKADMPTWGITSLKVIGVVEDYHFSTLKDEIEPLAILLSPYSRKIAIKVNEGNLHESLTYVGQVYEELVPDFPITYEFLDDQLGQLYANEQKQARVFSVFAMISVFLAGLGIFGLAAYASLLRQKELGIRKVLGASPTQIIRLISKDFVILVLIGGIIALPAAWYFIQQWLGEFPHRIQLGNHWLDFVLGMVSALIIAVLTVSVKTYQAAVSNPTESINH